MKLKQENEIKQWARNVIEKVKKRHKLETKSYINKPDILSKDEYGTMVGISKIETKANEHGVREMTVTFFMLGEKPPMDWFYEFYQELKKLCSQQHA